MPAFPTESELFPTGDLAPATAKAKVLQWFQAVTGLLGTTGNASDARTALSAAKSGANVDITSLGGLTTALSIGQGGTGATTASAARMALLPSQAGKAAQMLVSDGTDVLWRERLTAGTAVPTTSGTSIDFTSIPSWVKRITVSLSGLSTNGTSLQMLQLGDSGGIEAVGYVSTASGVANTGNAVTSAAFSTGFGLASVGGASNSLTGSLVLTLHDPATNHWVAHGTVAQTGGGATGGFYLGGAKVLSGALDRIRLTTVSGTDAFDAGSVNIIYE